MKDAADAILRPEQAAYLEALEPARDPLLARMEARAAECGHPISDPEVARFLSVTIAALARRGAAAEPLFLVELGTNIGYGAIVMARAAGPRSRVLTVEFDGDLCHEARGFIREAGLETNIDVRHGRALDVLASVHEPIDVAYIDCVKEEYPAYLDALLPRLALGGVIVADNVLWRGLVAKAKGTARESVPAAERARVEALLHFNDRLVGDSRLNGLVLPLGDGVGYAVKVAV